MRHTPPYRRVSVAEVTRCRLPPDGSTSRPVVWRSAKQRPGPSEIYAATNKHRYTPETSLYKLWPVHKHECHLARDGIPVRRPDSQSREPGFKSHCGRFEPLASLITPRCHSSLSCINVYVAIQAVVEM